MKQPKYQPSQEEVKQLKGALQTEKDEAKQVWKRNYQQLTEQEALLNCKEKEISRLKADLARLQPTAHCGDIRDTNRMEIPVVQGTIIPGAPTFSHRVVTMEQEIPQFEQYTARDSDEEPQFEPRELQTCRARRITNPAVVKGSRTQPGSNRTGSKCHTLEENRSRYLDNVTLVVKQVILRKCVVPKSRSRVSQCLVLLTREQTSP